MSPCVDHLGTQRLGKYPTRETPPSATERGCRLPDSYLTLSNPMILLYSLEPLVPSCAKSR